MQKKPGQISSNTLGLRFMQNAARAKQEREVKAAKAKVRTEEEWELTPDVRQSWGVESQVDVQSVSYEQSYLPFLFPGVSSSHPISVAHASGSTKPDPSEEEGDENYDNSPITYKGRRTFGKHGKEETEEKLTPVSLPPPSQNALKDGPILPRGARSISSHGRTAGSSSKLSNRPSQRPVPPSVPPQNGPSHMPPITLTQGFLKPQVEVPRMHEDSDYRKKRPSTDIEGTHASKTASGDDGARKRKKRKERDT